MPAQLKYIRVYRNNTEYSLPVVYYNDVVLEDESFTGLKRTIESLNLTYEDAISIGYSGNFDYLSFMQSVVPDGYTDEVEISGYGTRYVGIPRDVWAPGWTYARTESGSFYPLFTGRLLAPGNFSANSSPTSRPFSSDTWWMQVNDKKDPVHTQAFTIRFVLFKSRSANSYRLTAVTSSPATLVDHQGYSDVLYDKNSWNRPKDYQYWSPSERGGTSSVGGGGGSFSDGKSDDSDETVPDESAESNYADTGLFTIYAMDLGSLKALGDKLYTTNWSERLEMEVMKLLWNSPIEAAISLQSFPFELPAGGSATNIKFGSLVLEEIQGSVVSSSAMSINWGSIQLSEYWGNFLDYAPHTKIDLYLPWGTGFVPLDPHECLPGGLSVTTNIELSKGTCVHIVSGRYGVIGCYGGKCSTEIPLSALDTGAKMLTTTVAVAAGGAAILSAGAGAIGAGLASASAPLATGAIAAASPAVSQGAIGATLSTLSAGASAGYSAVAPAIRASRLPTAAAAALNPPHIQKSGSFYSSGAGLGPQKPFIIISRPEQNVPANYGHQYGYPSNITSGLSRGLGYTEISAIHLQGINATEYELAEIEKFLEAGVIL